MTLSSIKIAYLFAIFVATLATGNSQLSIIATDIPQIVSLLKDVNNTSANTSAVLLQLATLLKNQGDVQIFTNLLLQNNTATVKDFMRVKLERYDHIIKSQQKNQNQTPSLLQGHQNSLDQMVISLTEIANANIQMANTQTQMANKQIQMSDTLTQIAAKQTQMAASQTQTSNMLTQIASTQTQIANTFNQMVNLLQMQGQQLQNMTATMNSVVSMLENQQEIFEDINHSLPLILDQQDRQLELLNLSLATPNTTALGQRQQNSTHTFNTDMPKLGDQVVDLLSHQLQKMSSEVVSQLHAQTKLLFLQVNQQKPYYYNYCEMISAKANNESSPTEEFWDELYRMRCRDDVSGLL